MRLHITIVGASGPEGRRGRRGSFGLGEAITVDVDPEATVAAVAAIVAEQGEELKLALRDDET